MKSTITEKKNKLEEINIKLNETNNWISDLEGKRADNTKS